MIDALLVALNEAKTASILANKRAMDAQRASDDAECMNASNMNALVHHANNLSILATIANRKLELAEAAYMTEIGNER